MKLSNRKQLLSEADAELKRMQKLAGLLNESKKPLNEDLNKIVSYLSRDGRERMYDSMLMAAIEVMPDAAKEKFFARQGESLNSSYKRDLAKYLGKAITPEMTSVLRVPKQFHGQTIKSMTFGVEEGFDVFDITITITFEGGKTFKAKLPHY